MRQWYSRLFGDTTTFGLRVSFGTDAGRRALLADDVEASWGSLELWADGRCLTRSTDSEGATHDGVVWHLLPLLEWFAESSRSLLNEEAFPSNITRRHVHDATEWLDASESPGFTLTEAEEDRWMERRSDWRQRHAPRAGMQDAAFPMLLIRRVAHSAEISWDNERWGATRRGLRFTERRGTTLQPADIVGDVLVQALRCSADALHERCTTPRLVALARACGRLAEGTTDWRWLLLPETVATIDGDPRLRQVFAPPTSQSGIVARHSPETLALRGLGIKSPEEIDVLRGLVGATVPHAWDEALASLRRPTLPDPQRPWIEGYAAAESLRETLGWGDAPLTDLPSWLAAHDVGLHHLALPPQVKLLTVHSETQQPRVAVPGADTWSPNALATGLGHILLDPEAVSVEGPAEYWPVAARARAFGAMLTMPETGVRSILREVEGSPTRATHRIMARYGATAASATWHLRNLGLISEEERGRLSTVLSMRRPGGRAFGRGRAV